MTKTVSNTKTQKSRSLLQVYSGFWTTSSTLAFAAIAAGAEDSGSIIVTGVALGDHIVSFGFNTDPEENIFIYNPMVTAADTVTLSVTNLSGSSDTPTPTQIKLLIARPKW